MGLQTDSEHKYPFWEQLVRECTLHMHSAEFRDDFYPLIKNDEIYLKMFCLHLWLIADRLKHSTTSSMEFKMAKWVLCGRRFPNKFYADSYLHF